MHQPWPSAAPGTKSNEKTLPQYSKTMHGRIQGEYTVNNGMIILLDLVSV